MARRCPYCGEAIGDESAYSEKYGMAFSVSTKHRCKEEDEYMKKTLGDIFNKGKG